MVARMAAAEPEVQFRQTTYPVSGKTVEQIRRSLDDHSPVRQDGRSFDAYTQWDVDWHLTWFEDPDGTCRPTDVTTRVRVHVTLPDLEETDRLPEALAERWRGYLRALTAHEQAHARIGIEAARAIEAQLMRLGERPACAQLAEAAELLAREIIDRHAAIERQYDAETRFGAREGARFP